MIRCPTAVSVSESRCELDRGCGVRSPGPLIANHPISLFNPPACATIALRLYDGAQEALHDGTSRSRASEELSCESAAVTGRLAGQCQYGELASCFDARSVAHTSMFRLPRMLS